jgi:hypothetical protein
LALHEWLRAPVLPIEFHLVYPAVAGGHALGRHGVAGDEKELGHGLSM